MGFAAIGFSSSPLRAFAISNSSREEDGQTQVAELASPCPYKWRMVIAYDGTKFKGWQYQPAPPTIQCLVENALIRITKLDRKELCLVGASRTDTGVHAWAWKAFTLQLMGFFPQIFSVHKLSPHAMREAAAYFVGKHDFSSFANASHNDGSPNPVKEIFRFDITELDAVLQLEIEGTGFLYRQVRNMVALLLQIGREALPPDIVPKIIAARDRRELAKVALSAPPHGLCLMSVNYNQEVLEPPEGFPPVSFGRSHHVSKCKLLFY
ncbi:uncharacterized protein [Typha angustifolia]|uniref:uncharacterized protein isoform X2 n=1 Tax=Typha angustifolia TaxID=59011 RepID=UPI003C2AE273